MTELKNLDTASNVYLTSSWQVVPLTNISQGTGAEQRVGNRVRLVKVSVIGAPNLASAGSSLSTMFRFMCVIDKQPKGLAAATGLDIMSVASPLSFTLLANAERFEVIHDKFINMCANVVLDDFCFELDLDVECLFNGVSALPVYNSILLLFTNLNNTNQFYTTLIARVLFTEN